MNKRQTKFTNPYIKRIYDFKGIVYTTNKLVDILNGIDSKKHLDIGCGNGELLYNLATRDKRTLYIGVELQYKELYRASKRLQNAKLQNTILVRERAENLISLIKPNSLDSVSIFFPDPWPKPKHKKHRLLQKAFILSLLEVMKPLATLHFKTDSDTYFRETIEKLYNIKNIKTLFLSQDSKLAETQSPHTLKVPATSFERIFLSQNKMLNYIVIEKH